LYDLEGNLRSFGQLLGQTHGESQFEAIFAQIEAV